MQYQEAHLSLQAYANDSNPEIRRFFLVTLESELGWEQRIQEEVPEECISSSVFCVLK